MKWKLAPSILAADFARLGEQVRAAEDAGVEQFHVDVMDGHFVPNLSMGPVVVRALRRVTALPLDVHLMITEPGRYVEPFVAAGADHISFHVEVGGDAAGLLDWLSANGIGRGIALNPETPVDAVLDFLPSVDMVLVMTVNPGFGGQSFLSDNLEKVRRIRAVERDLRAKGRLDHDLDVEVDGGVDRETIVACAEAGANVFVAGSSIFASPDIGTAIHALRGNLKNVVPA